jgi:hypothetical protein
LLQARGFVEDCQPVEAGLDQILLVIGWDDDGEGGAGASALCSFSRDSRATDGPSRTCVLEFIFRRRRAHWVFRGNCLRDDTKYE